MSASPLRVVQYGLGPIGQATARAVCTKPEAYRLVGAIDIDPDKVGRDVAEVAALDTPVGVAVADDPDAVLAAADPDVVLHTTTSALDEVAAQLVRCARAGAHVVSSTEELSFPHRQAPATAERLDRVAREEDVVLVGTGVNPGYAMDTLPLVATGGCTDVDALRVTRVVEAGARRAPLQKKVGAGCSVEAFEEGAEDGTFGHVGLRESLQMVAHGLGWPLDRLDTEMRPITADAPVETEVLQVAAGEVAGIHQTATGIVGGRPRVHLALKMYVGAPESYDAVEIDGTPPIDLRVRGGVFGDTATVGMLVNTAPLAADASPGLRTMTELPVPRAAATAPNGAT